MSQEKKKNDDDDDDGGEHGSKSILQAKLARLAILIGYFGTLNIHIAVLLPRG